MKVFDGRKATEDYMSAHTLTFSTPDLTLKRFAFWLGDMVPDKSGGGGDAVPRLYSYVDERDDAPVAIVDEERYTPTGAVRASAMYGSQKADAEAATVADGAAKFCSECGKKVSSSARFCTECGTTLEG